MLISPISEFFIYSVIAIFAQNAVFGRALGIGTMLSTIDSAANTTLFGLVLTAATTISSIFTYVINHYLIGTNPTLLLMRPLIFIMMVSVVYLVFYYLIATQLNFIKVRIGDTLAPACFNCAVLGSLLYPATQHLTMMQTIGFGFGSGIGFTFATMIVAEGQRKLQTRNMPVAFKGLPLTLLYIGMLSLAIYGFIGQGRLV